MAVDAISMIGWNVRDFVGGEFVTSIAIRAPKNPLCQMLLVGKFDAISALVRSL